MSDEEYQQYAVYLTPAQWEELGKVAKGMGIVSRQPLIRWAVDAFLMSKSSTYRIIKDGESKDEQVAA